LRVGPEVLQEAPSPVEEVLATRKRAAPDDVKRGFLPIVRSEEAKLRLIKRQLVQGGKTAQGMPHALNAILQIDPDAFMGIQIEEELARSMLKHDLVQARMAKGQQPPADREQFFPARTPTI